MAMKKVSVSTSCLLLDGILLIVLSFYHQLLLHVEKQALLQKKLVYLFFYHLSPVL